MKAKLFDLSVAAFHLTSLGAPVVADARPYVVIGLFSWRRKRKASAILSAT